MPKPDGWRLWLHFLHASAFGTRRLARLYPQNLFTLLACLLVAVALGRGVPVHPGGALATFIQYLTLTQIVGFNLNGSSWTYPAWPISAKF